MHVGVHTRRAPLGERTLDHIGYSCGTLMGQQWSQVATRLRAMYDGTVTPATRPRSRTRRTG